MSLRIALLAARKSVHTVRWANALAERGLEVHLLSMRQEGEPLHADVRLHELPIPAPLGYWANGYFVRRLLRTLQPDILHAHYASGFGTLARMSKFHPCALSVWGSDVYMVPFKSRWHRGLVCANLRAADRVLSTSEAMARQIVSLEKDIQADITPFGIDTALFSPRGEDVDRETITIGTVKTLARHYGIDLLIEAFAEARCELAAELELADRLRLLIVGGGPLREELEKQVARLGLREVTSFVGPVAHAEVPEYLRQLDIYVAASRSESFGVAVIEASACGVPVIVSDVGGLPEVVEQRVTGLITPSENVQQLKDALLTLIRDRALREGMGRAGRDFVMSRYDWDANVATMIDIYQQMC